MTLPKHSPEASRRCQARNAHGSQCRNAAHEYVTLDAHRESLLCPRHARLAREDRVQIVASQEVHHG